MKSENEVRLKELEEMYMSKKENSGVGRVIRERMGLHSNERPNEDINGHEFERAEDEGPVFGDDDNKKKKKSVKIFDGKENVDRVNEDERAPR